MLLIWGDCVIRWTTVPSLHMEGKKLLVNGRSVCTYILLPLQPESKMLYFFSVQCVEYVFPWNSMWSSRPALKDSFTAWQGHPWSSCAEAQG